MSSSFSTNLHWRTGESEAANPLTRSISASEWMSNANDHSSMVTRSVHALARGVSVPSRFGESRSLGEEPVPRTGDSRLVLRATQEDAREGATFGEQIVQGSVKSSSLTRIRSSPADLFAARSAALRT